MMADPLFTPNINIKEEREEAMMPDITIKNEPLSPPPQSVLEHEYDCGLVPKVEPYTDYTDSLSTSNRDTERGYSDRPSDQTRVQQPTHHGSTTTRRTVCGSSTNNSTTSATTPTSVPTTHRQLRHQARFLDAVQTGNLADLEHLLDVGELNVNGFDAEGQTALHRVCCDGNLDIVKLLVRFGADVRLCNRDGWAALHLACWGGNQDIVAFLLSALKTRTN